MDSRKKKRSTRHSRRVSKKRKVKKRSGCYICGKPFYGLPFQCRRCNHQFCEKHRLPESHNCSGLRRGNAFWKRKEPVSHDRPKERSYEPSREIQRTYEPYTISPEEQERINREFDGIRSKKSSKKNLIIGGIAVIVIIVALQYSSVFDFTSILLGLNCSDGTYYNHCSEEKPYFCNNGTLIEKATRCGCPYDYRPDNETCEKIKRCDDGTEYGTCSHHSPFLYCSNGYLIRKASECGCETGYIPEGDNCVHRLMNNPINRSFVYTLDGNQNLIKMTLYRGMNSYLAGIDRYYYCDPTCPSDRELEMRYLDEKESKGYLNELVDEIKSITNNDDDRARVAISIVQNIPYDWDSLYTINSNERYPYEVLYDNEGVCGEKSKLLAYLLREIGFGVVLFSYEDENHMAVGIKCPDEYDYIDSGYCFIEASTTSIITDSEGDYVGVGQLQSTPDVILISDGNSFDSVDEEHEDAILWNYLNQKSESSGGFLSPSDYRKWERLVDKYGITFSEEDNTDGLTIIADWY
jgi:predicted nucleic acid binding AN1-type Zn finger protein